jgi:hypothetical protein
MNPIPAEASQSAVRAQRDAGVKIHSPSHHAGVRYVELNNSRWRKEDSYEDGPLRSIDHSASWRRLKRFWRDTKFT